jgi:hypothetical protein
LGWSVYVPSNINLFFVGLNVIDISSAFATGVYSANSVTSVKTFVAPKNNVGSIVDVAF